LRQRTIPCKRRLATVDDHHPCRMGHRPGMSNQKAATATLMCDITPKVLSLRRGKDNDKIRTITNLLEPSAYKINFKAPKHKETTGLHICVPPGIEEREATSKRTILSAPRAKRKQPLPNPTVSTHKWPFRDHRQRSHSKTPSQACIGIRTSSATWASSSYKPVPYGAQATTITRSLGTAATHVRRHHTRTGRRDEERTTGTVLDRRNLRNRG